jgi:hypothetical protein
MNSRRFIPYSSELEDDKTQRTTSRLWLRSPQAQMLRIKMQRIAEDGCGSFSTDSAGIFGWLNSV